MKQTAATPPLPERLASDERDRARDQGHFTQYGMRIDSRPEPALEHGNPGTGDHARRFGASGDLATYANREGDDAAAPLPGSSSDAPSNRGAP